MLNSGVTRLCWLVLGLVVGAVIAVLVVYFTVGFSSCDESISEELSNATGSRATDTLKMVVVMSRHGNRAGYKDYFLDPYPLNDTNYWPYGTLALSPYGRIQSYKLGVKLRSFYNGFLPTTFKTDDIYGFSNRVERVVMSGELVLAGLYPPQVWQIWDPTINWQPIALYTNSSDRSEDIVTCLRFSEEKEIAYSHFLEENAVNITDICSSIFNFTGANVTDSAMMPYYDKLSSEATEGYVLPSWTQTIYPEPLTALEGELFIATYSASDIMVRLIVGEMFDEIVQNMQLKSLGNLVPDRKIYIYSGQDTTVVPLQVAFGIERSSVIVPVKTASALIAELHQDPDMSEFYLKVLYVDGSSPGSDPVTLSLPDCGDPCYLDDFVNVTQKFTSVNFEEECLISRTTESSTDYSKVST